MAGLETTEGGSVEPGERQLLELKALLSNEIIARKAMSARLDFVRNGLEQILERNISRTVRNHIERLLRDSCCGTIQDDLFDAIETDD